MYVSMYVCMHACMHVCMYVCLGKSWACKHWKFQNNYFVIFCIFVAFFLHLGLSFWICVVIFLSFFVISLSFLCHFLSFVCHFIVILLSFWERENGEKTLFKNDYHDRPFVISWQHQIQGTSGETLGKPAGGEEG